MVRSENVMNSETGATPEQRRVLRTRGLQELETLYGEDRKFIWALARAMDLLQAFRLRDGAMGNAELAESTGIPKATVTRITYTLTELGYLNRDASRKYYPSPTLLTLSHTVLGKLRIRQMAQSGMQELANLSGASVAMSWPEENTMIYIAANSYSLTNGLLLDVGARVGMASSAIGRAYLACLDEDQLGQKFEVFEALYGDGWPELKTRILRSIEDVRTKGFCIVDREWRSNVRAVAVPIYDADHQIYMSMNCGGPAFLLDLDKLEEEYGPRLVHLAAQLGWRAPWK